MSYENPKIQMDMSLSDILVALSIGNPGALTALMRIVKEAPSIDPDDALTPFGPLFGLDNLDCYGPRIWMLYKDVCDCQPLLMLAALRSVQLGLLKSKDLNAAIDGQVGKRTPAAWLESVKARLPNFGAATPSA